MDKIMPCPNVGSAIEAVDNKMNEVCAENGLKYTIIGYVIESLNQAITDEDFEICMKLLNTLLTTPGVDIHSPCWVAPASTCGSKVIYYPPLEYLCVLHKVRLRCSSVAEIIRSISRAGAKLHPEMFMGNSNVVDHAQRILQFQCARYQ